MILLVIFAHLSPSMLVYALFCQGGLPCLSLVDTRVIGCWAIGFGGRKSFEFCAVSYWS